MSTPAIVLLTVSMVMLWGGLAAAIVNLVRHPDHSQDED